MQADFIGVYFIFYFCYSHYCLLRLMMYSTLHFVFLHAVAKLEAKGDVQGKFNEATTQTLR